MATGTNSESSAHPSIPPPISSRPVNTQFSGWVLLNSANVRTSTNNNQYISWQGLDAAGKQIRGTWFFDGDPRDIVSGHVYDIAGRVGEGRDKSLMFFCDKMVRIENEEMATAFIQQSLPRIPQEAADAYASQIRQTLSEISEPSLKALALSVWDQWEPRYRTAPAGKVNHDAKVGGLLQHSWEVMKMCDNPFVGMKNLDRDVLVFSAVFHDLGKVREYNSRMDWSETGRLVSHISDGFAMIDEKATELGTPIPTVKMRHIKHCIDAHHGKDHGYVAPRSREALILHYVDNLIGLLSNIDGIIEAGNIASDGFGPYSMMLGTQPWVPQLIRIESSDS